MMTRRNLLGGVMITAGTALLPAPTSARFLGKINWKAVGDAANVATILEFVLSKLGGSGGPTSSAPKPRICSVNLDDLLTIGRLCFQLSLLTNTKDHRAAIDWRRGIVARASRLLEGADRIGMATRSQ
jgi:hypothetical protein